MEEAKTSDTSEMRLYLLLLLKTQRMSRSGASNLPGVLRGGHDERPSRVLAEPRRGLSQTHHGHFSFLLLHAQDARSDLDGEKGFREISGRGGDVSNHGGPTVHVA